MSDSDEQDTQRLSVHGSSAGQPAGPAQDPYGAQRYGADGPTRPDYRYGGDETAGQSTVPDTVPRLPVGGGIPETRIRPDTVPPPAKVRRFWSQRRVPAAVVAVLGLAVAGVFLYDVVAVRTGRRAMSWRDTLARELATRHLDDTWVKVGAGVAAVLGLWLLVLALTPGRRRLLPQRPPSGTMRSGIDRATAAGLLQDSAMRVAGVSRAEVRVSRRRATVRANVRFRDVDEVRNELTAELFDRIDRMSLVRQPKLALKLRPVRG